MSLVLVLIIAQCPLVNAQSSGRATPSCTDVNVEQAADANTIPDGACLKIDLGVLTPGDAYGFEWVVVDDPIDILLFNEVTIGPYELGQSYRSTFEAAPSTEHALGGYEFHWTVPSSINEKRWFLVLDNLAHGGDTGEGDQGGNTSTASASINALNQAYYTPYDDLVMVQPSDFEVILEGDDLRLDAGTILVLSAWDLEFEGDLYLQTRSMHDTYVEGGVGLQYITGGAMQSIDQPMSLTYIIPQSLDGQELVLIVDNTDVPLGGGDGSMVLRMTVRVELSPPLTPVVMDDQSQTVSIGETLTLDATTSPNRLGQIASLTWDQDASDDADGDGVDTNDVDATGFEVELSWDSPGQKTVTIMAHGADGSSASIEYTVEVQDTVAPTPAIQVLGNATKSSGIWNVGINEITTLSCTTSTDDVSVDSCEWFLDNVSTSTTSTYQFSSNQLGEFHLALQVTDTSGNQATTMVVLKVIDLTVPSFNTVSLDNLPSSVTKGESTVFTISVQDEYDQPIDLVIHWDLDPLVDSDMNGNPRDDPDKVGLRTEFTFPTAGEKSIVVTVFDASNNSVSHAFSLDVKSPTQTSNSIGQMVVGFLLIIVVIAGIAVVSYRRNQYKLACEMLTERGLDLSEAKTRISAIKLQRTLSMFASAHELSGLDQGDVVSEAERQARQKQAEHEAIYGSTSIPSNSDELFQASNHSFSPQPQLSEASQAAAAEAAELLGTDLHQSMTSSTTGDDALLALMGEGDDGDTLPPQIDEDFSFLEDDVERQSTFHSHPSIEPQSSTYNQGVSFSFDIESVGQPQDSPEPSHRDEHQATQLTCEVCQTMYEVEFPPELTQAIIACPSCGVDQIIRR